MNNGILATIELMPGACSAHCASCPVGKKRAVKPDELEAMNNWGMRILDVLRPSRTSISLCTARHSMGEDIQAIRPIIQRANSIAFSFGGTLKEGIDHYGGFGYTNDIFLNTGINFATQLVADLMLRDKMPRCVTIMIRPNPGEKLEDIIKMELIITLELLKKFKEKGFKKVPEIHFRHTKNELTEDQVRTRHTELGERFFHWGDNDDNKIKIGDLGTMFVANLYQLGYGYSLPKGLCVGDNRRILGEEIVEKETHLFGERVDGLQFSCAEFTTNVSWYWRLMHHRNQFGMTGDVANATKHSNFCVFTLIPGADGQVETHFMHSALDMLISALRFRAEEMVAMMKNRRGQTFLNEIRSAVRQRSGLTTIS